MADFHGLHDLNSPLVGGAAGALFHILTGGFKGAWIHRVAAFISGFSASIFISPALVEFLEIKQDGPIASGLSFCIGALALAVYARLLKMRLSASVAGVTVESQGHG